MEIFRFVEHLCSQ